MSASFRTLSASLLSTSTMVLVLSKATRQVFRKCYHFSSSCVARKTHYETLGISTDASKAQIKSSFYRLSKQHHPDLSKDPSSPERFTKLSQAYQVLINDRDRRAYDRSVLHRGTPGSSDPFSSRYSPHHPSSSTGPRATWAWKHSYSARTARGTYHGTASSSPFTAGRNKAPQPDYDYNSQWSQRYPGRNPYHDVLAGSRRRQEDRMRDLDKIRNESTFYRAAQLIGMLVAPILLFGGFGTGLY